MEAINKMKLCPLCRDRIKNKVDWPYTEMGAKMHEEFELHSTLGKTWKPERGHKDYDVHCSFFVVI